MRWPSPEGRASIAQPFAGSQIVLSASSRTAGAIDSLAWNGREFLNRFDHGRELQSAASFDGYGECLNPTEAGSDADGMGPESTSRLISLRVQDKRLHTRTRMAWWVEPGETSRECPKGPGGYASPLSDAVLTKDVEIGVHGVANAIAYRATFSVPHAFASANFEVLTGYMPPDFSRFWSYDPRSGRRAPLSDGPGEQPVPVILATEDGAYAMGVYSPDLPQAAHPDAGFGRFRFPAPRGPEGNATVKWNCVYRHGAGGPGPYAFTCYTLVGTLEAVEAGLSRLHAALSGARTPGSR
ncbi:hypothetical protein [Methylobacterium durans]|uniref:Uncharacterized protein n=1 Tax=Methylobacterium durans TaxID=2202825 RepID=A0A2U8W6X2_9HYPH|nr:hypothetical protein [Methylobacterium durans]AWN41142.1 hypothetical protein DK389_12160 [Methylobacterium durans]